MSKSMAERCFGNLQAYYEQYSEPERNEWQDVIYNYPVDIEATEKLDPQAARSDVVVFQDGSRLEYSEHAREWLIK